MTYKTGAALGIHADLGHSTQNSNMIPIIPNLTQAYRQGPAIDDKITKHSVDIGTYIKSIYFHSDFFKLATNVNGGFTENISL